MDRRLFLSLAVMGLGAGVVSACGGGSTSSPSSSAAAGGPALLAGRTFAV